MEALRLPEVLVVPPWEERFERGEESVEQLIRSEFFGEELKLMVLPRAILAVGRSWEVEEVFSPYTADFYTSFFLSSYALPKLFPLDNEKDGFFQENEHLPFSKT